MRKKLIEVALPLEAINEASAREKSIRHGHPSTLHLWWARRPLAAARAVLFASLVDDPDHPEAPPELVQACRELPKGKNATANDTPRMRLFDFIETLVQWESTTNEDVLNTARRLIRLATNDNPPPLLDPFAGGGSIPLEAQRLGLEAHASDLNPVAVMINKALIEIPPRFANLPPVNPEDREQKSDVGSQVGAEGGKKGRKNAQGKLELKAEWKGVAGLAADVRYYGQWMRDEAFKRIGHLYPTLAVIRDTDGKTRAATPDEIVSRKSSIVNETVIAWLWARTVTCPNPACGAQMPLVRSFELSKKKGREIWVEPICTTGMDNGRPAVRFEVRSGKGKAPDGTVNRRGAKCVCCNSPVPFDHIRAEGRAGRMGSQLMAIVTEGSEGRSYYSAVADSAALKDIPQPSWEPDFDLPKRHRSFQTPGYGLVTFAKLFTSRQLVALNTFADLLRRIAVVIDSDSVNVKNAIVTYLSFAIDKAADYWSSVCSWHSSGEKIRNTFGRQAIQMVWDFAECNPFSTSTGNWMACVDWVWKALLSTPAMGRALVAQRDATTEISDSQRYLLSTDPPYYDNIAYADLSDFFYVWMRRLLAAEYPELFSTIRVPKETELVAAVFRGESNDDVERERFEKGIYRFFVNAHAIQDSEYPFTVFYAFKQADDDVSDEDEGVIASASTGWETMLEGLLQAKFMIMGTWPIRTELMNRNIASAKNALASSIVLVCRPRPDDAPTISRRQFVDALRRELPAALKELQSGNIAPVDLAQASIGPGMAIYSRYSKVLEADGSPLTVRAALGLINQELDTYLEEQDGSIDSDTRFAVAWFQTYGFGEGEFGVADVLARAKNTSVEGVVAAGVAKASRGKVQLSHWREYDASAWNPQTDRRATVWEATHHLIERLNTHGEYGAGLLLAQMSGDMAAEARALAYRLYSICERKGWAEHARDYNALVVQWTGVQEQAKEAPGQPSLGGLFGA